MMYYLPEYRVVQIDAAAHAALTAYAQQAGHWTEVGDCLLPASTGSVLLVLSHFGVPGTIPPDATLITNANEPRPFEVWQLNAAGAGSDYLGFNIGSHCLTDA